MSFWSWIKRNFGLAGSKEPVSFKPALIIAAPDSRGINAEFRLPDDPEHVIRINQPAPKGLSRKVVDFVSVAGTSQPEVLPVVQAFVLGSDRSVELRPMPESIFDPNAIAVIGRWKEEGFEKSGRLGYVPADIAAKLSAMENRTMLGATLKAIYLPRSNRNAGIRIAIWAPRRRKQSVKEMPYRKDLFPPNDHVERNLLGMALESDGLVDNAVECYEANVRDGFTGNHPYERLAIIFRRRGDAANEVRVLRRAIEVFEQLPSSHRADVAPKLEKFRNRLSKATDRNI